jgi:hypothetical protein
VAGESFTFGLKGSGAFNNAALWTPTLGAPPRSGQDQDIAVAGGVTLNAVNEDWADYDMSVVGAGSTIQFGNQTFGSASSVTQTVPDATYAFTGMVNSFAEIDIGGTGSQATANFSLGAGATFANNGPLEIDGNLLVAGAGSFINNSTITIKHGVAQFQSMAPGSTAASVLIGQGGALEYKGTMANSAIAFESGENGRLLLGTLFAATSLRTVIGFDAGDVIIIPGQGVAAQFQQAAATGGAPNGVLNVGGAGGDRPGSHPVHRHLRGRVLHHQFRPGDQPHHHQDQQGRDAAVATRARRHHYPRPWRADHRRPGARPRQPRPPRRQAVDGQRAE